MDKDTSADIGADTEVAESPQTFTKEDWDRDTRRARKAGEVDGAKRGRNELIKSLGVESEDELGALLEVARRQKASEPTPEKAELEKIKAKFETELAKERARAEQLQAVAERSMIVAEARRHLDDVFDSDLFLAKFGLAPEPEKRLAVVDGRVAVVDRDGEVVETNLEKFFKAEKSKAQWLVKGRGGGTGTQVSSPAGASGTSGSKQTPTLASALSAAFGAQK